MKRTRSAPLLPSAAALRRLFAGGLLALLLVPAVHARQTAPTKANTRSLFLSVQAQGAQATLDIPGFQTENTRGGTVKLGYGFSRAFTLYLGLGATFNRSLNFPGNSLGLGHLDAGMQFHLGNGSSPFVPYFDIAASRREAVLANTANELTLIGYSGAVGGGVKLFAAPTLAIDLNARITRGIYDQLHAEGFTVDISQYFGVDDLQSNDLMFGIGLSYFPLR
jgi:hypothetical protein